MPPSVTSVRPLTHRPKVVLPQPLSPDKADSLAPANVETDAIHSPNVPDDPLERPFAKLGNAS